MIDAAIRVKTVVIASKKRRRTKIRRITAGITQDLQVIDGIQHLTIDIKGRQFTGKMTGTFDPQGTKVDFTVVEETTTSYLKKHHFKLVGYEIDARITNTSHRR